MNVGRGKVGTCAHRKRQMELKREGRSKAQTFCSWCPGLGPATDLCPCLYLSLGLYPSLDPGLDLDLYPYHGRGLYPCPYPCPYPAPFPARDRARDLGPGLDLGRDP